MELLYLWIHRHNNLQELGINFSNEYEIQFNPETNTLTIEDVKKEKLSIFNPSFLNVTALIGKNGVGKTTVLSEIKRIFSSDFYYPGRNIFIARDINGKIWINNKFSQSRAEIKLSTLYLKEEDIIFNDDYNIFWEKINLIFYSNAYSLYGNKLTNENYADLSFDSLVKRSLIESNKLLLERYDSIVNYKKVKGDNYEGYERDKEQIIKYTSPRPIIYSMQMHFIIDFISNYYMDKKWDFLKDYMIVSFNYNFFESNKIHLDKFGLTDTYKYSKLLETVGEDLTQQHNVIKVFRRVLSLYLLVFSIKNNVFQLIPGVDKKTIVEGLNKEKDVDKLPELLLSYLRDGKIHSNTFHLWGIIDLMLNFDKEFNSYKDIYNEGNEHYGLLITEGNLSSLKKILNSWNDPEPLFRFHWGYLSAGEYAMLSIFSRINAIGKNVYSKTIWLLIDEGELYLHPEWQRSFFNDLHKYLPIFFKDNKIQLFLTSHSPFVVSDLPLDNIILMDRDENRKGVVIEKEKLGNTFGANIHTLLSNTFFMDRGQMGEFAKTKIFELLDEIESTESLTEEAVKNFEQRIKIIGEPTIRQKLQEKLYEKVGQDLLLQKKIELEKELQQIDQKIKNRNHEAG